MGKKNLILFVVCFVLSFLISWFCNGLYCDEIWNYGFAYNIASGLIPYNDFNLLTPPLYHLMGALFIKLLGNSLLSFEIFNSLIVVIIMFFMYKKVGKVSLILFPVLLCYMLPNYNFLSLAFLIIIMIIDSSFNSVNKYYFIGILIGLILCTKQSIGILLFLVMIIFSKERVKALIGFIIPICFLILYLIYNDCLMEFINYNFGGMISFKESNTVFGLHMIIFIPILIYLIVMVFKTKFKDFSLLLVLAFQSVAYPIFDRSHIMMGVVALIAYLLINKMNYFKKYFKYYFIISLSLLVSVLFLPRYDYHLYKDKDSFMYGKAVYGTIYDDVLVNLEDKVDLYKDSYDYIFIYSYYMEMAYAVKLNMNIPLNKYDLINNGNMGYDGANRYLSELEEICSNNSCLFFIDLSSTKGYTQTNMDILKFGTKYDLIDRVNCGSISEDRDNFVFDIYSNINYID